MAAGRRDADVAIPKHRGSRDASRDGRDLAAPSRTRGPGRRRRQTTRSRFAAWLGFGRRARLEREQFEAHLRELRLATATLRAEISVLRHELEVATAIAAERAAETKRMTLLLPMVRNAFAAASDRRMRIYLGYAPDVQVLETAREAVVDLRKRPAVIDLEPEATGATEIVLPLDSPAPGTAASPPAAPAPAAAAAGAAPAGDAEHHGAHRRTA